MSPLSNIIPGILLVSDMTDAGCSGGRVVGCRVGRVGGSGTVLAWFWHCPWHCPGTCSTPAPALAWAVRPPRICTRPYPGSARLVAPPCTLATLGTPPGTLATLLTCTATWWSVRCRLRARGAHSGLQPWTDSGLMSAGPLRLAPLPADRHPMSRTLCHSGVSLIVQ